ncbi:hypothetical protein [Embleya sp. NPDC050493]|uniref:hypothetical protein n=1 Tax=Embleya sp. NPDC050493 TaxID=3363989 RepID=UPI00379F6FAD
MGRVRGCAASCSRTRFSSCRGAPANSSSERRFIPSRLRPHPVGATVKGGGSTTARRPGVSMLVFKGDFAIEGHGYATAVARFKSLGLWDTIEADQGTTLTIASRKNGRQGDTTLIVGTVDTVATIPHTWCTAGVHLRPVEILIEIVAGCGQALTLELLAHEWCLHGAKDWDFVQRMRHESNPEKVKTLAVTVLGTAKTATEVVEHRELAENTHDLFRTTLFRLRGQYPDLADGLLQAWRDDIEDNKASARDGHLAEVSWSNEDGAEGKRAEKREPTITTTTLPGEESLFGTTDNTALEDWLGSDVGSDEDEGEKSGKHDKTAARAKLDEDRDDNTST